MAFIDDFVGIISFLTVGVNIPQLENGQKSPKKSKSSSPLIDTSEICLETQKLSSKIFRSLNPEAIKEKKERILNKLRQRYTKINKKIHTAGFIRLRDKIMFMATMINLIFLSYLLGRHPCYFSYYYIVSVIILVPMRFVNYRIQKYHYFLLDFCYYANLLAVVYLYFYPSSQIFYNISFAFACGPLLIAVPLFTNSFVPHSIDRITSLVIHLLPALTL